MSRLEGKVALITGGGVGIGGAVARLFAREGAAVVITGRRKEVLERVVREIEREKGRALAVAGTVTDETHARAAVVQAVRAYGKLNVLVNNAGIGAFGKTLHETDDATWAWLPGRKLLLTGDLFIWATPNAGNPQKVQRYVREWAAALREMVALGAEYLLPGHGVPIVGADRIVEALTGTADLLDSLHDQTVAMMNEGARLNDIVHTVRAPAHLLEKPYLQPVYDDPEFIVHNIWRLYGGWYDGNPSTLKPAREAALAEELAALAGGAIRLAARARELAANDDGLRLAGHLVELAALAAPDDRDVQSARAEVFERRVAVETSTMAKGIFAWAASESRSAAEDT